ncbi:hypothetical protein DY000_02025880 [Brassica cretica]|uniref:Major facilitator superfamily (MFS) profile domain-containing protein n=1 Tax=Brassica cretica TaxID=69181 RepID=A0ABQ7E3H9_BRACR|nr:hypothetical protein DY000_02025880 [Brassica cretica]
MEEGLLKLKNQNDTSDCRITACVILSTFVAVCGSFSFGVAAKVGTEKELENSLLRLRGRDADISHEASEIQLMTRMVESDSKSSFSDLFQRKYRHTLVVGIGLMLIQQFSGSAAVISYASTIFRKADTKSHDWSNSCR